MNMKFKMFADFRHIYNIPKFQISWFKIMIFFSAEQWFFWSLRLYILKTIKTGSKQLLTILLDKTYWTRKPSFMQLQRRIEHNRLLSRIIISTYVPEFKQTRKSLSSFFRRHIIPKSPYVNLLKAFIDFKKILQKPYREQQ